MLDVMHKGILLVVLFVAVVAGSPTRSSAEALKVSDVHLQLAERHLQAGHPFWAIHSYRRALASGADNPNTHRKLSQVLYDLGFVDQAINEMELALKQAANEDFLHMEMGVFCLAAGKNQRALNEFSRVLELNAGFSYGYYYLSEVYYRLADYPHAAAALVLAQKLGLPGFEMERKLSDLGWPLPVQPWQTDSEDYCLRQIILDNKPTADEVMQRLSDGELFEELARQFSTAPEAVNGGYIGRMVLASMPEDIAAKLASVQIFSAPMLLQSDDHYIIVQRIAPFAPEWWQMGSAATEKNKQRQPKFKEPKMATMLQSSNKDYGEQEKVVTRHVKGSVSTPLAEYKPYVLLSGVFHNRSYAEERVIRLRNLGIESFLQQRGSGEHLRYEVVAGRFAEYKAAEDLGGKIVAAGLDFYIRKEK